MNEHEKLRSQLAPLVEQPEPSTSGDWYAISTRDLLKWDYIEIHFSDINGDVNCVRLTKEEDFK